MANLTVNIEIGIEEKIIVLSAEHDCTAAWNETYGFSAWLKNGTEWTSGGELAKVITIPFQHIGALGITSISEVSRMRFRICVQAGRDSHEKQTTWTA